MKSINIEKIWNSNIQELESLLKLLGWKGTPVVYGIFNIVYKKWYVGYTKDLVLRFSSGSIYSHIKKAKDNKGYFINPNNYKEFEIQILDLNPDNDSEESYIKLLNSYQEGYNGTKDGKSGGDSVSGSIKIYNPITNEKKHWHLSDGPIPEGWIEGRGYDSKGSLGMIHYYDPNTLNTITCPEGEQPEGYIKGQGWNSTLGTQWLYSCKLKKRVMRKLTDESLKESDDWRLGSPKGDFWNNPINYEKPIIKFPWSDSQ